MEIIVVITIMVLIIGFIGAALGSKEDKSEDLIDDDEMFIEDYENQINSDDD